MSLKEIIQSDLRGALKSRDEIKLQTLRLLSSAVHNEEIAQGSEISDKDVQTIVKREVKKRQEAIESFRSAGRNEAASKETTEMNILKAYLPEMMSDEEITTLINEEITNNPDANAGQIIGAVIKRASGNADGKVVAQIVNQKLSQD